MRLTRYLGELEEFFRSRGMRFGEPEDVIAFAAALGVSGSFHEELMSMARAIVFREGGVVPRTEMLELMLVAMGGVRVDQTRQLAEPVSVLQAFVGEVVQSFRRPMFVDDGPEEEPDEPVELLEFPDEDEEPSALAVLDSGKMGERVDWVRDWVPDSIAQSMPLSTQRGPFTRLEQASARDEKSDLGRAVPPPPKAKGSHRTLESTALMVAPKVAALKLPSHFFRRTMWALSIGLLLVVAWRHWHPTPLFRQGGEEVQQAAAPSAPVGVTSAEQQPEAGESGGVAASAEPSISKEDLAALGRQGMFAASPAAGRADGPPTKVKTSKATTDSATSIPTTPVPGAATGQAVGRRSRRQGRLQSGTQPVVAAAVTTNQPPGVSLVSSGMMTGNLVLSPLPKYPKMATMWGIQGQVIVQAVVSSSGKVVAAHVLEGHRTLRGAATSAVRRWKYRPYMVSGKAIDVDTIVTLDFRLPH